MRDRVHYTWGTFLRNHCEFVEALNKFKCAYELAKNVMPDKMTMSAIHYNLGILHLHLETDKAGNISVVETKVISSSSVREGGGRLGGKAQDAISLVDFKQAK